MTTLLRTRGDPQLTLMAGTPYPWLGRCLGRVCERTFDHQLFKRLVRTLETNMSLRGSDAEPTTRRLLAGSARAALIIPWISDKTIRLVIVLDEPKLLRSTP